MRAGLLRHPITIESKTETRNSHGEMSDSWAAVASAPNRARIVPKAAAEGQESMQSVARRTHEITVRYFDGITANMRVVFGDRTFYIDGPPRDWEERGIFLVMDAREAEE